MQKPDLERLANQFMNNAVKVKAGEKIWIEYQGPQAHDLAYECAKKVRIAGGKAVLMNRGAEYINRNIGPMSDEEITTYGQQQLEKMKQMKGYIRIGDDGDQEKIKLPAGKMEKYKQAVSPRNTYRVEETNWLVVTIPTEKFAASCGMDLRAFEKFYLDACMANYGAMSEAVKPLKELMDNGKSVRILSPNQETDLTFSIEGIPAVPCIGERNIPDGECFTAPVKNSINGTIKFGPSSYDGQKFKFIKLRFKDGRVEQTEAENSERTAMLNKMLDTDPGARYVGEFAINFNPFIKHPTGNILFDEKIDGGVHLALGDCYKSAPNGNKSAIHWDMVHIQREDCGGGELYIDGELIRENGIFKKESLKALNPENLRAASKSFSGLTA